MFAWGQRYLPAGVLPADQIGSMSYYALRLIEQLVVFSIPAFLFVSGYSTAIVAGRSQKNLSWQFVLNRIKSLLIPYLIWSSIVMGLGVMEGRNYSPLSILTTLLTGNANEVLYFVPLLIQFYLLSPILVIFARKNWKALLLATGSLQIMIILFYYLTSVGPFVSQSTALMHLIPKALFLTHIFWFPFGIVAGFNSVRFKAFVEKYWRISLILAIVLIPLGMLEWETLFRLSGMEWLDHKETLIDTIYALMIIFSFLAFKSPVDSWYETISRIGTKSYGIYLTHAIFIVYTSKAIYRFVPDLLGSQLLLQPILILVGLGLPLLIMKLVDISPARKIFPYLFG
jgi:membrane-bound acyltransferase YfiQ involved in biofilm formation